MAFKQFDYLLWLDIETNGGDERSDGRILQIGVYATQSTPDLAPLWEYESLCSLPIEDMEYEEKLRPELTGIDALVLAGKRCLERMPPVVIKMHNENGLADEWTRMMSKPDSYNNCHLRKVQNDIMDRIDGRKVALAGSGVSHFDVRFLRVFFPKLVDPSTSTYYQYDVGNVRRFLSLAGRGDLIPKAGDATTKLHRGLADAKQHAEEARVYMSQFKLISS